MTSLPAVVFIKKLLTISGRWRALISTLEAPAVIKAGVVKLEDVTTVDVNEISDWVMGNTDELPRLIRDYVELVREKEWEMDPGDKRVIKA